MTQSKMLQRCLFVCLAAALPTFSAVNLHMPDNSVEVLQDGQDYQLNSDLTITDYVQSEPVGDYQWIEIPNSSMRTVFNQAIDYDQFYGIDLYPIAGQTRTWTGDAFDAIQSAWSGAAVANGKFYVNGGGHAGSPHNGVFSMDADGNWERVTEPSQIWLSCPDGICTPPSGADCEINQCSTLPDGNPASVHTYGLLASDGQYLYRSGGSTWYKGSVGDGPVNWKMDLSTGEWSSWSMSGGEGYGSMVHLNGKLYIDTHKDSRIYNIATDTFEPRNGLRQKFGPHRNMVVGGGYIWIVGKGDFWRTRTYDYPANWEQLPHDPVVDATGPGAVWYQGRLWVWDGGCDFSVYDGAWETVTPSGPCPAPQLKNGTYGRMAILNDQIYIINGVDENAFKVAANDPLACAMPPDEPAIVQDPRGPQWGHSILIPPAIGQSEPASVKSCAQVSGWACVEVSPDVMDSYTAAVDSLPEDGGVVILSPGVHVLTSNTKARRKFKLLHVLGVPDDCGNRPILRSTMTYAEKDENGRYQQPDVEPKTGINFARTSKNLILENVDIQNFAGSCVRIDNGFNADQIDQTVLVKNSLIHHCYYVGFSMGRGPLVNRKGRLYVIDSEMGHISSGAHMLYLAGGRIAYAKNSYFHSAGWHSFKAVAHNIAIVDSVLSQDGLDGKRTPRIGAINEGYTGGQGAAASLVACQKGVISGNRFIQRAGPTAARQRRYDIDGCDYGAEYTSAAFWSDAFWYSVILGGDVESGNPQLLPVYWYGNTFTYTSDGQNRFAVSNSSTFPNEKKGPLPAPDSWVERSRDVFCENAVEGYESQFSCGSQDADTAAQCQSVVHRVYQKCPDWVADPTDIHPDLREMTVAELYAA